MNVRSWLYVPGHRERFLAGAFSRGADAVVLDLEDAVPVEEKGLARGLVGEVLSGQEAWVRVNRPLTKDCELDLAAVADRALGLRLPKVESAAEIEWVRERAPGVPLDCLVESAAGVLAAAELARQPGVVHLSFGSADLAADLRVADEPEPLQFARLQLVLAARAAGLDGPSDGVHIRVGDLDGLREAALAARRVGFSGKSAIHPEQVAVINDVFRPRDDELEWAQRVMDAFERSGGSPTTLEDGEFVDAPVAMRAAALLEAVSRNAVGPDRDD